MKDSVTPVISSLAKKSYLFTNHLSGGNVTHAGIFSLMYGLQPTYLRYMSADPTRYEPVFMRMLKDRGYAISVYTTSNLDGFSLKKMIFQDIRSCDYWVKYDADSTVNDRYMASELIKSIKAKNNGQPFFKFVFLTSSHHGYTYPGEHDIFHPVSRDGTFLFNKYADPAPLLNRYRNSLHYLDSLFGEVLRALNETRLDRKTIIVLTSDHGEEFNDRGYGYWGHGSNFTRSQTSVPLVLYLPDNERGFVITRRSSHIDVVPTLMRYLFGCCNASDYSSGSDLFDLPDHRSLIVRSYKNKAYVIDNIVISDCIPVDSYDFDDLNKKNIGLPYREIQLLKRSEALFVR